MNKKLSLTMKIMNIWILSSKEFEDINSIWAGSKMARQTYGQQIQKHILLTCTMILDMWSIRGTF